MKPTRCLNGDCYEGTNNQAGPDPNKEEFWKGFTLRADLTSNQRALAKSQLSKYMDLLAAGWALKVKKT